jgi:hypothetical protein
MEVFREYLSDDEIARLKSAVGQKITSIEGELLRKSDNIYDEYLKKLKSKRSDIH